MKRLLSCAKKDDMLWIYVGIATSLLILLFYK